MARFPAIKIVFSFLKKYCIFGPTKTLIHLPKRHIMNIPENLRYTKDHEWVRAEGDIAVVGITDFAQHELGDIVYLEVSTLGETLEQEETFGTIEAVKTVSDLFMPVGGHIESFNEDLEATPDVINKDPYGEGWIIKIKMTDPSELESLLTHEQYAELTGA